MNSVRYIAVVVSCALLVACSAGGSNTSALPPSRSNGASQFTLRFNVPSVKSNAIGNARRRESVAWNTSGILATVYQSPRATNTTALASAAFDVSATSANCTAIATGRSCTFTFGAVVSGTVDVVVKSYDQVPASGAIPPSANQLGVAVTAGVTVAPTTNVSFTIDGVLAKVAVLVPTPVIPAAAPFTQSVSVEGLDADGNTILADSYADSSGNPVTIALALTGAQASMFTLGSTSMTGPVVGGVSVSYTPSGITGALFASGFQIGLTATPSNGAPAVSTPPILIPSGTASSSTAVTTYGDPGAMASGADGNLYAAGANNNFFEATPQGVVTSVPAPAALAFPSGACDVSGPGGGMVSDGHSLLWMTCDGGVASFNPVSNTLTGYGAPNFAVGDKPFGVAIGSDTNLWYTDESNSVVGTLNITTSAVTRYTLSAGAQPYGIAAGPDGALWFTEHVGNKIGRMTTGGSLTEYPIPTVNAGAGGIVVGPDGALWFAEDTAQKVGRITTSGTVTEYALGAPSPTVLPFPWKLSAIVAGPDGNIWIGAEGGIVRMTTSGSSIFLPLASVTCVVGLAVGSDGNIWFDGNLPTGPGYGSIGNVIP